MSRYKVGDIVRDNGTDIITGAKVPPTVWRVVGLDDLGNSAMCIEHGVPGGKPVRMYFAELLPPLRLVRGN